MRDSTLLRHSLCLCIALMIWLSFVNRVYASDPRVKPRVIATTDGEIDDRSSMIRFLMYASDYDVAGIIEVNSKYQKSGHSGEKWLQGLIDKYGVVLPNLLKHNPNFPSVSYLKSTLRVGNENINDLYVTPDKMATKNTAGEKLIIQALLDSDPRPVHVLSWGGANTTASALWRLKYSGQYTTAQFNYAVSKIRCYFILYQDGGCQWIEDNVKEALIVESYDLYGTWDYQSITAKTVNPTYIQAYMTSTWLNTHVKKNHGVLGAATPQSYVSEGDSPSFYNLINNGLQADTDYTLGGWGGRSIVESSTKPKHLNDDIAFDDGVNEKSMWRWIPDAQNDFQARMDWCVASSFSGANHAPLAQVVGSNVRTVAPGQTITLDATGTTDPDGNALSYNWWQYYDADNATTKVAIANSTSKTTASFVVPNEPGKQVHIILEVLDNGTPRLKGYQRIIFKIGSGGGCSPTAIVPYLQVNGGTWTQTSSATLTVGSSVSIGPQPVSGGSWTWSGPNGYSATSRVINFTNFQTSQAGNYLATYTNAAGCKSTQTFGLAVEVAGCTQTPITPYVKVNSGSWAQTSTATVNVGGSVVLGPHPTRGGSWSWSGPNGYRAAIKEITLSNLQPNQAGNYVTTYTNPEGCKSTHTFVVTVTGSVRAIDTSLEENLLGGNNEVMAYPNPSTSSFLIKAPGVFSYIVTNYAGKVLESGEGNGQRAIGSQLPQGLYLIKIQLEGKTRVIKAVKQ